jgi:hypothetical protein
VEGHNQSIGMDQSGIASRRGPFRQRSVHEKQLLAPKNASDHQRPREPVTVDEFCLHLQYTMKSAGVVRVNRSSFSASQPESHTPQVKVSHFQPARRQATAARVVVRVPISRGWRPLRTKEASCWQYVAPAQVDTTTWQSVCAEAFQRAGLSGTDRCKI